MGLSCKDCSPGLHRKHFTPSPAPRPALPAGGRFYALQDETYQVKHRTCSAGKGMICNDRESRALSSLVITNVVGFSTQSPADAVHAHLSFSEL